MRREVLRDRSGRVLGYYEDNGVSGRITARDAAGRFLGRGKILASLILCEVRS